MTHTTFKTLVAAATMTLAGVAMAQGTPPNANTANPATGAGQQTQQGTPMGTTGVPAANQGTSAMPNTNSQTMSNDSSNMGSNGRMRPARADRN
ncbi:MAG: proteophosphoglycan ppg4 [Gammaproteobacteria bacterium]|nr:proteophosphoglycan ppg4 [Gammaproteobacteria bacterium]MBU1444236.1 proteophosphoglycan ppg4 [Gammaproteobacteria bacterium]MBU2285978.1 proteophosphoglycan ppg4 [Gammaproteobacteria bacterium]MBU2407980.1 proteophosphoglycan ppg4 [Gammaproteobacteria bacterium]